MAGKKRNYDDACGTAHALELVGDRWALLIVRELLLGAKRFSDLRSGMPGISANVLTQRLEELEGESIVVRRKLPPPAAAWVYELTPWGLELEEPVKVLGRWAARSPSHDPTLPLSASSLIMSMRTMYSAGKGRGLSGTVGLRIGTAEAGYEDFLARLDNGVFSIARGDAGGADAIVTGHQQAMAGVIYGGVPLPALERQGALTVVGNRKLFERYVGLFVLPQKAERTG